MKIKDFQFIRYLLTNEMDIPTSKCVDILNSDIDILHSGEPDTVVERGEKIIYYNPSSTTRFLFGVLYTVLKRYLVSDVQKDKLGLALLSRCKEYVYMDYEPEQISGPPILLSCEKIPVVHLILSEIIEPLIGRIKRLPVFFIPCKFTDTCRIVDTQDQLIKYYDISRLSVPYTDFPLIVHNCNIYNNPASNADLLWKTLVFNLGENKTIKIIRNIFLENDNQILDNLIVLIQHLRGEPGFVVEFLDYLGSNIFYDKDEVQQSINKQVESFIRNKIIKQADSWSYQNQSDRINKQWSQWSMMLGLIEKQLTPVRGSLWPATEKLKPIEDKRKEFILNREIKKGRKLTIEEMLEIARDIYDHNARPGTLIETMLKDNRVFG